MQKLPELDQFDIKLLAALQADASATNADVAALVGLSHSQVSRRRLALEAAGIIERYRAVLNAPRLGLAITVFVHVSLDTHSRDNARLFYTMVEADPNILEAYSLTGDADYFLKVMVEDLTDLSRVVNEVLLPHPAVARVKSEIVLQTLKKDAAIPLKHLSRRRS